MASAALQALATAIAEIAVLSTSRLPKESIHTALSRARAAGRAQAVLLSSHFERYFYAVNEEAVNHLNEINVQASKIPLEIRLLHSKDPLEQAESVAWLNREEKIVSFIQSEGWLWNPAMTGQLTHSRMLGWMSAPKPKNLVRYYKYWNIEDIFTDITRSKGTRNRLWLGVQELVDKRNNIAHGDFTAQATATDITRYTKSVQTFCERADKRLARAITRITGNGPPW